MWHMGDMRYANRVLVKRLEEKRSLARSKVSIGG
jgi:hypothetical protein